MSHTRPIGAESLVIAMKMIATEGMESRLQINKIHKQIDKDAKNFGWSDALISTMDPEWQWRVCCARLKMGILDWTGWEWRDPRPIRKDLPLWKGQSGRVLVHAEQGLGDEIMFSQCIPDLLKTCEVFWECDPRLEKIFKRSFPETTVLGRNSEGDYDFRLPIGDLAKHFRKKKSDFTKGQYLLPDPTLVEKYKDWLIDKPKVGVSWQARQYRCQPEDLAPEGINLQYDDQAFIEPPFDLKNDIEDLFALIVNLEKVVCVPTSVLHIAGSLGVKVEAIMTGEGRVENGVKVNNALNWRFLQGKKMYWHDSVKIYRSLKEYK